jgi:hypothetical protein
MDSPEVKEFLQEVAALEQSIAWDDEGTGGQSSIDEDRENASGVASIFRYLLGTILQRFVR